MGSIWLVHTHTVVAAAAARRRGERSSRSWRLIVNPRNKKANLVIQNTTERIFAGGMYCDVPRGILIVRGENVLLLGEIDLDREDDIPLPQRSYAELAPLQEIEKKELKRRDKVHRKKLRALGFEDEGEVLH